MTNQEWLGLIVGWAVSLVRDSTPPPDVASIEAGIIAARANRRPVAWDVLRTRLALSPHEQRALALLIACELSLDLGSLIARNNDDPQRSAPDVELLRRLVYSRDADGANAYMRELSASGALQRYRLIDIPNARRADEGAFLLRQLRATRRVVEWVHGHTQLDSELTGIATFDPTPDAGEHLLLDGTLEVRARQLAASLASPTPGDPSPILVLAGSDGVGRRALFARLAAGLKRPLITVDCERLPFDAQALTRIGQTLLRETLLLGAIPVLHRLDALPPNGDRPDRLRVLEATYIEHMPGLIGATASRGETRPAGVARGNVIIDVDPPSVRDRSTLWQRHLGETTPIEDAQWAAARYTVTPGVIARAARSALTESSSRNERVTRDDIHRGIRTTLEAKLASRGRRVAVTQTRADLVLPEETLDEINEIIARVKHRGLVYEDWGLAKKIGRGAGLSVLFSGPPGTGKTMVAGIIANELGLDLYQVDLSQTVSKYIGETEKNLSALFDAAEAGHAVLLFDEADSMFAKRTEVKSSNDRYANLEVNFLLQRMESFTGISILTTNLEASIDEAFKRRLSFRIAFPLPEAEERERLWRTMLPPNADLAGEIQFTRLSERFEMSGGYIKNAVVRAAFMAADRGEPLGDAHLFKAAQLEYAAMGKVMHGL